MLRESAAPLSRHGDLVNGFTMPGTDIHCGREEHDFVNNGQSQRRKTISPRDVQHPSSAVHELM
jgi:hypothetical protein